MNEFDILGMDSGLPVVLIGERLLRAGFDHVLIDNEAAAYLATTHLLATGRRRIATIGVIDVNEPAAQSLRFSGYLKALASAHLEFDPALVGSAASGRFEREDGARAMRVLIERGPLPDAVFCFNDLMAIGAMRTALSHGIRIPNDIAFIGINDIEEGRYTTPTLSSIAPDKEMLANLAVELLIQRIESRRNDDPRLHYVPFKLVARESTAPTM